MQHTRELHIVSGELNILKRTLYPLYNMINALREPRGNRQKAGYFAGPGGGGPGHTTPNEPPAGPTAGPIPFEPEKGHGADISSSARVYLADVADHVLILTEEVDMLRGTVENMINLVAPNQKDGALTRQIFNMVTATQNESMRQLTMANLIFLPLTFITGYFGMNFNQDYWQVMQKNGPLYFWQIAIPTTVLVIFLLAFSYLSRLLKTVKRQVVRKGIKIKLRKSREMRRHRGLGVPSANTQHHDL
jgi:Mg2+ and Co2+ transporter CorA